MQLEDGKVTKMLQKLHSFWLLFLWCLGIKRHCPIHEDQVLHYGSICMICEVRNNMEKIKIAEERLGRKYSSPDSFMVIDGETAQGIYEAIMKDILPEINRHQPTCPCSLCENHLRILRFRDTWLGQFDTDMRKTRRVP